MHNINQIFVSVFTCMIILLCSVTLANSTSCTTSCSTSECTVELIQNPSDWIMTVECGEETMDYTGTGDFQGTICNGVEPCNVPMRA